MLIKILFTLAVVVVVALVFRTKAGQDRNTKAKPVHREIEKSGSLSVRTVAYGLLAVLVMVSAAIFVVKYQSDNRIITIRVIAEDGASTTYQAKQKTIKGRQFITLDDRRVTLGESDRIELMDQ